MGITELEKNEVVSCEKEWQNRVGGQLQMGLKSRPGTRLVLDKQFSRIAEALNPKPGSSVLDIGCGTGNLCNWLADNREVDAIGVDLAVNNLLLGGSRNMICGNAETLPIKDSSFRYLVCKGSVHHFLAIDNAFKEMYRVLKPGGTIVFYEPMGSVMTNFLRKIVPAVGGCESPVDLLHKEEFTAQRLQQFLRKAGFVEIQISFHDTLAHPLTGAYVGGLFSGSVKIMKALL